MKLLFKGAGHLPEYHNSDLDLHLVAGQECEVSDAAGSALIADFGGIFVEVKAQAIAQDIPAAPASRQIKEAVPHKHVGPTHKRRR